MEEATKAVVDAHKSILALKTLTNSKSFYYITKTASAENQHSLYCMSIGSFKRYYVI